MDTSCLVLAAGEGKRFGMEKQYFAWRSKMLWQISYNLAKNISQDVVCVGLDVDGGNTRQESVRNGLASINSDRVVIIEIVRPLVEEEDVQRLLEIDHPSVTYGLDVETPVYDRQNDKYLLPNRMSIIQNLQVFDTKLLKEAHRKTSITNALDDTMLMHEVHGIKPHIVRGDMRTLWKLTYQDDVEVLDALASKARW
tara:strand:+ start:304 stop:894 length:591 start_codon:yes stop_codon:yes gene_type:complete